MSTRKKKRIEENLKSINIEVSVDNIVSTITKTIALVSGDLTQIVDIRTKFEYDTGHYPDSVHIPVNKISSDTVKKAGLNPVKPTLVYCNTGQRARVAANKLESLGFREVYYIEGTYSTIL